MTSPGLREKVRTEPDNPIPKAELGKHLLRLQRYAEAESLFRDCTRLRSGHAEYHALLGHVLSALGRQREAEEAFGKALQIASQTIPNSTLILAGTCPGRGGTPRRKRRSSRRCTSGPAPPPTLRVSVVRGPTREDTRTRNQFSGKLPSATPAIPVIGMILARSWPGRGGTLTRRCSSGRPSRWTRLPRTITRT